MWAAGQLESHEPIALTRAVWYTISMSFGLRGRHEARQMMWRGGGRGPEGKQRWKGVFGI